MRILDFFERKPGMCVLALLIICLAIVQIVSVVIGHMPAPLVQLVFKSVPAP